MRSGIFKLKCGDKSGTGIVLSVDVDGIGIILTAKHCLKGIEDKKAGELYTEIIIHNYPQIEVLYIKKHENMDFALLICRNMKSLDFEWEIAKECEKKQFSAEIYGFPEKRKSEKNEFSTCFSEINFNGSTQLYIGKMKEDIGEEKSLLMKGMSGAPVYAENLLYGMYLGSLEEEYKYNENRIIPIQIVLEEAQSNDWLFFKKFLYADGIKIFNKDKYLRPFDSCMQTSLDLIKHNNLNFLLIGKSGNGKSSFIRTFLKHGNHIPSTGKGRTTRFCCDYNVKHYSFRADDAKIEIKFYTKDEFVISRKQNIQERLKNEKKVFTAAEFRELLCVDKGFFDVSELGDEVEKEVDNILIKIFKVQSKSDIVKLSYEVEKEDSENNEDTEERKSSIELIEDFYREIYEVGTKKLFSQHTNIIPLTEEMSEKDKEFLTKSFTVGADKITYSGWVKKIVVTDRVSDEYCDIFEKLNIDKVSFVDTYGLDHVECGIDAVETRLRNLFNNEYKKVKNVLYVRRLDSDSPNDLEQYLPILCKIDAAIVLNVIFTRVDKDDSFISTYEKNANIDLMKMNEVDEIKNKAIDYFKEKQAVSIFGDSTHPLKKEIANVVNSEEYANSIFESLVRRLTPYCGSDKREDYIKYFENNLIKISELFKSIITQEYKGDGIINIKKYESLNGENRELHDTFEQLIGKMFDKATIEWSRGNWNRGHWKTKKTNIDYIQKENLGYYGVNDNQWGSQFKNAYNDVFALITNKDFKSLFGVSREMKSGIAIQRIVNEYKREMIGCARYDMDGFLTFSESCKCCNFKRKCFRTLLLKAYDNNELNKALEKDQLREEWLNKRCNFSERYRNNKEIFMDYFDQKWKKIISKFEEHNQNTIEKKIIKNEEIKNGIQILLKEVDSKFPDAVKEDLENYILQQIVVKYKKMGDNNK